MGRPLPHPKKLPPSLLRGRAFFRIGGEGDALRTPTKKRNDLARCEAFALNTGAFPRDIREDAVRSAEGRRDA